MALAAAAKGDAATAHVAIKEFVTLGQITEMDQVKGTTASSKSPPPGSAPARRLHLLWALLAAQGSSALLR